MSDPQYYQLSESRWLADKSSAAKKGDPYYYGIGGVDNISVDQPWAMQTGPQPKWMGSNAQPGITQNSPWSLDNASMVPQSLGSSQPNFMLGQVEPIVASADYQGRKWANGLGEGVPFDYQGRTYLGEIPYSGLGMSSDGWRASLWTIAVSALVAAGVCYFMRNR